MPTGDSGLAPRRRGHLVPADSSGLLLGLDLDNDIDVVADGPQKGLDAESERFRVLRAEKPA